MLTPLHPLPPPLSHELYLINYSSSAPSILVNYHHFANNLSSPLSLSPPIPPTSLPSLTTTPFSAPAPCTKLQFSLPPPPTSSPSPTNLHLAQAQFHILVNSYVIFSNFSH
ncbi:hypothetical protein VNO78_30452 [Psophocarpus tetragonolobus]|uniref:Uncharacterized protein n=1 Tax=Psophocarpus tetragonolobus TaxID=3891 RepID=A0AAN9X6P1_PSOTE